MKINAKDIQGLEPVATGYKIFNDDWTAHDGYCYADENGNAVGSVHKVDGELATCKNGLHFCKNAADCIKFYSPVSWNRFAEVSAYGEVSDDKDGKSAARILRIDRELTFNEFVEAIKAQNSNIGSYIYGGSNISGGSNIYGGRNISGGSNISGGRNISGGSYISGGSNIYGGRNISGGSNIYGGSNISGGRNIYGGSNISGGRNISGGSYIYGGSNINGGRYIYGGSNINGGSNIYGANDSFFCAECRGIDRCIFVYQRNGKSLYIFNHKTTAERFATVKNDILSLMGDWFPKFNNAYELKGAKEWDNTPAPKIESRDNTYAYKDMPQELIDYIKAMPEYDAKIFAAITGLEG